MRNTPPFTPRSGCFPDHDTSNPSPVDAVIRRATPGLHRIGRRVGLRADQLDDLSQDTALTLLTSLRIVDLSRSPSAWLRAVAWRKAQTMRRRPRYVPLDPDRVDSASPDAMQALERAERQELVHRALGQLHPCHRQVLELYFFRGIPAARMAEMLGCRAGTIRSKISRALAELQRRLPRGLGGRSRDGPAARLLEKLRRPSSWPTRRRCSPTPCTSRTSSPRRASSPSPAAPSATLSWPTCAAATSAAPPGFRPARISSYPEQLRCRHAGHLPIREQQTIEVGARGANAACSPHGDAPSRGGHCTALKTLGDSVDTPGVANARRGHSIPRSGHRSRPGAGGKLREVRPRHPTGPGLVPVLRHPRRRRRTAVRDPAGTARVVPPAQERLALPRCHRRARDWWCRRSAARGRSGATLARPTRGRRSSAGS